MSPCASVPRHVPVFFMCLSAPPRPHVLHVPRCPTMSLCASVPRHISMCPCATVPRHVAMSSCVLVPHHVPVCLSAPPYPRVPLCLSALPRPPVPQGPAMSPCPLCSSGPCCVPVSPPAYLMALPRSQVTSRTSGPCHVLHVPQGCACHVPRASGLSHVPLSPGYLRAEPCPLSAKGPRHIARCLRAVPCPHVPPSAAHGPATFPGYLMRLRGLPCPPAPQRASGCHHGPGHCCAPPLPRHTALNTPKKEKASRKVAFRCAGEHKSVFNLRALSSGEWLSHAARRGADPRTSSLGSSLIC